MWGGALGQEAQTQLRGCIDQSLGRRCRLAALIDSGHRGWQVGAVGIDTLIAHADAFEMAARQLNSEAKRWNAIYRAGAVRGTPRRPSSSTPASSASRVLLSIVKGTYGHDTFSYTPSYTPQSTMIPCLYDVARLAMTLETQRVRDRNRVGDALVDARLLIETSLSLLQ